MSASKGDGLIDARRLSWPADWPAIFGRDAPLCIEIGFGNGRFLTDLAQRLPAANVLGLEISLPSIRRAARRLQRAGLSNVRLMNCDAIYALWALCAPASVADVYINFPDPWPKAAHHHRRLISDRFLALLGSRAGPGAHLEIATDHEEYAQVVAVTLQRSRHFYSQGDSPFQTTDHERLRTKYEESALAAGRTCYYFKWRRNSRLAEHDFPVPEELPMPHVVLRSALTLEKIAGEFTPVAWHGAGAQGRFLDVLHSSRGAALLVDTYVSEEPMSQRIALIIRPRGTSLDEWIIGLHELGFPRPTAGVHQAIAALVQWLMTRHRETEILENNLRESSATIGSA